MLLFLVYPIKMLNKVSGNDSCFQNYWKTDMISRLFYSHYVILIYLLNYDPVYINSKQNYSKRAVSYSI